MQVSDAMIGREGQVYGRGRLSFLGMDQVTAEATTIEVAGSESSAQFFTAAPSDRDQRSGYLTSDRQGATVRLPVGVGSLIGRVVKYAGSAPLAVAVDAPGGVQLPGGGFEHGASDWRIVVTAVADDAAVDPGAVRIDLSAALRPHPADSGPRSEWPSDVADSRLSLECTLDPATRALAYGSMSTTLYDDAPGEAPLRTTRTTAASMRLAATPVGADGGLFARTDDGRLVSVIYFLSTFTFCAPFRETRSSTGFVEGREDPVRVSLRGVDLERVRDLLTMSRHAVVELVSDDVGSVQYTRDNSDGPGDRDVAVQARLAFDLRDDGLRLEYLVRPRENVSLSGAFTLPWEILILGRWTGRYGRSRVLAGRA